MTDKDITFSIPDSSDLSQLKGLWLDVFGEDKRAVELIFDNYFDVFNAYCAKCGELTVSALYLCDCSVNGKKAHYLCGAATLPEFRNRGIMSRLINFALEDAKLRGDEFSLLYPAEKGLYDFYSKLGYSVCGYAEKVRFTRNQLKNGNGCDKLPVSCFDSGFVVYPKRFTDFSRAYYKIYGSKILKSGDSVAVVDEENGCTEVVYGTYTSIDKFKKLLLDGSCSDEFTFTVRAEEYKENYSCSVQCHGMIKPLGSAKADNVFIGITLA